LRDRKVPLLDPIKFTHGRMQVTVCSTKVQML